MRVTFLYSLGKIKVTFPTGHSDEFIRCTTMVLPSLETIALVSIEEALNKRTPKLPVEISEFTSSPRSFKRSRLGLSSVKLLLLAPSSIQPRSEEHTYELQSRQYL